LVRFVHVTPREAVAHAFGTTRHATVHGRLRTPRKCEEYCERELDDLEYLGHRVYLHLGVRRDDRPDQDSGQH
jgi:hypothetical protein